MLEIIFYILSGLFMKISDDAHDRENNALLGVSAAIICGFSIGYLAVTSADAACIFLAILIGTIAAWKVDCLNHILSLLIFVGIIIILGFPAIGLVTLFVCAIAAFLDEIGNDSDWAARRKYLHNFFQYRFALKIAIFIFTILGLIQTTIQIPGIQIFSPLTLICFLLFEVSYELAGLKFDAIYNGLKSLLGIFRSVDGSTND
ncbi:MAG: hypothetical protein A4E27_00818 [Methanobacterium sp. PtaU1.Bin242]|nr:MAG: hypothetical protein A4E27_00818 [Methanobacterium sp. PtaU1.Bin242]